MRIVSRSVMLHVPRPWAGTNHGSEIVDVAPVSWPTVVARPRHLLAIALLVMACAGGHAITGTFVLTDDDVEVGPGHCEGTGGYSDIREGLDVVVKDGTGTTIATGQLDYDAAATLSGEKCAFRFALDVPDAAFYSVAVGHRGELTFSKAEMEAQGWSVGFTLGA